MEAIQFLDLTTKTEELKQLKDIFPQNQLNKLINGRLKEITKIQGYIELSNLNYSTNGNKYNSNKHLLPAVLLKKSYDGNLTPQDAVSNKACSQQN